MKVPNSNNKKNKTENPPSSTSSDHAKQKKEKLGERIAALQQLVSPFGKTDTASVLHEAMGYIRFLHDQVQVLCSPYLQILPSSSSPSSFQHQCIQVSRNFKKPLIVNTVSSEKTGAVTCFGRVTCAIIFPVFNPLVS
ncbi:hypothetical protein HN873_008910 [Arachis hypogaea]